MQKKLDSKEIKHLAHLARLELNEAEVEEYRDQLGQVLGYVEKLKELDTTGVETADGGVRELYNIWREDREELRTGNQESRNLIDMAPEAEQGQVKVKKVL